MRLLEIAVMGLYIHFENEFAKTKMVHIDIDKITAMYIDDYDVYYILLGNVLMNIQEQDYNKILNML